MDLLHYILTRRTLLYIASACLTTIISSPTDNKHVDDIVLYSMPSISALLERKQERASLPLQDIELLVFDHRPVETISDHQRWWESFKVLAKALFAQQLGCCPTDLNIRFETVSLGTRSLGNMARCATSMNTRCFAVLQDRSPELDAVEMVVVLKDTERDSDLYSYEYSPESGGYDSDISCCEDPALSLCWGNLCGPRFFIEWALHFHNSPEHICDDYNSLLKASKHWIKYDDDAVARRWSHEHCLKAHHTTDHDPFQKEEQCPCVTHKRKRTEH